MGVGDSKAVLGGLPIGDCRNSKLEIRNSQKPLLLPSRVSILQLSYDVIEESVIEGGGLRFGNLWLAVSGLPLSRE